MPSLAFTPLLPTPLLWAFAGLALLAAALALLLRGRTGLVRALALLLLVAALANPTLVSETREPVKDIVAVVVDRSGSQGLAGRPGQTDATFAALERRLAAYANIEIRRIEVGDAADGDGTHLFAALEQGLADVPPERIAGILAITDGVVHDIPAQAGALGVKAPFHALVTGRPDERDRRVELVEAPRFGLVGKDQIVRVRLDERGGPGRARLSVRRDGQPLGTLEARAGTVVSLSVRIDHAGPNVVEIEVEPLPGELTPANNRVVATIEGVREKLRVLLVSGEPHAGERTGVTC